MIVVGDTRSALAGARAAQACGLPLAHVEAGLRSFDHTMPEEAIRREVDALSCFILPAKKQELENLRAEHYKQESIHLVGNVMADSLYRHIRLHPKTTCRSLYFGLLSPSFQCGFREGLQNMLEILKQLGGVGSCATPPTSAHTYTLAEIWNVRMT
ncbi:MAG: UDP-N-acetylglucosamine 2-epimerase [Saprospiraceae bacterium]